MPHPYSTDLLIGWEGYSVQCVTRREPEGRRPRPQVHIELVRKDRIFRCSGCRQVCTQIHEVTRRRVRDLPILDADTFVWFARYRVTCPHCGPKAEALPWLEPWARVTTRFAESIVRLCRVLPVQHVADWYGLDWDTVKHIDQTALASRLLPVDVSGVTVITLDEFALRKRHRYATVILDPRRKRVLWVGRGRAREDIQPFFQQLGPDGCGKIQAAVMDMNAAYEEEVRAQCPQAEIVYDLFHVVAKYGREVIDRVRVEEAKRVRHDKQARKVIKGTRWLLLRNWENVPREDRITLTEVLAANRRLTTTYILKDDLKALWTYRYPAAARRFFQEWYHRAIRSRIESLKTFARNLKTKLPGILAHCRYPFHTSLLEGINNKIKVLKRMAFGYRDDAYFFLKIMDAFPGFAG